MNCLFHQTYCAYYMCQKLMFLLTTDINIGLWIVVLIIANFIYTIIHNNASDRQGNV